MICLVDKQQYTTATYTYRHYSWIQARNGIGKKSPPWAKPNFISYLGDGLANRVTIWSKVASTYYPTAIVHLFPACLASHDEVQPCLSKLRWPLRDAESAKRLARGCYAAPPYLTPLTRHLKKS